MNQIRYKNTFPTLYSLDPTDAKRLMLHCKNKILVNIYFTRL